MHRHTSSPPSSRPRPRDDDRGSDRRWRDLDYEEGSERSPPRASSRRRRRRDDSRRSTDRGTDREYSHEPKPGRSPSPDPMLQAFLSQQQNKELHTSQEAQKIFSTGLARKSKFQKDKEEAEKKRKLAEQEAADVYKDFVESFDKPSRPNRPPPRGFVRPGGKTQYEPGRVLPEESTPTPYPPRASTSTSAAPPTASRAEREPSQSGSNMFGDDDPPSAPPPTKRAKLSSITSELRRAQEEREASLRPRVEAGESISAILGLRKKVPHQAGDQAAKDKSTTNVCVSSLPGGVNERVLGNHFSQFGDVASVKIMWPRTEEVRPGGDDRSMGCTAFIAYVHREDAERAVERSDGHQWRGAYIGVGWGKAVNLPPVARYPQATYLASPEPEKGIGRDKGLPSLELHRQQVTTYMMDYPRDAAKVETLVDKVRAVGHQYEEQIKSQAGNNPDLAFLFDPALYAHQYYRMLLDDAYDPVIPVQPFSEEGPHALYDTDSEEEVESNATRKSGSDLVGPWAQRRFEAMLRALTPRRERIARAMQFVIEHSYAAASVVQTLVQSLLLPETPIPRKLARLWIISDVLHNSGTGVSQTWKYRLLFEDRLPQVFAHWGAVAHCFGRIKQEGIRMQVNAVINTWENALVFPSPVIDNFRRAFEGSTDQLVDYAIGEGAQPRTEGTSSGSVPNDKEDVDGKPLPRQSQNIKQPARDESERLIELQGSLNSQPTDGEPLDGEPLDGEPLDGEPWDGEPLDGEPWDGEPLGGEPSGGEPLDAHKSPSLLDPLASRQQF